jgi:hypothetical protein
MFMASRTLDGGPSVYGSHMSEQPEWYERILELQLRENPEIWARFQEEGIDEDELRLGFIYLAPSETAANELAGFLRGNTDYEVEVHSQRTRKVGKTSWLVVGATQPAFLTLELLDEWVEWMVAAGAAEGPCAFDGWAAQQQNVDPAGDESESRAAGDESDPREAGDESDTDNGEDAQAAG